MDLDIDSVESGDCPQCPQERAEGEEEKKWTVGTVPGVHYFGGGVLVLSGESGI